MHNNSELEIGNTLLRALIITIFFMMIFCYLNKNKKWSCKEDKCELTLFGGKFDTKKECEKTCKKEKFDSNSSYICNNNYQCVEVPGNSGDYTNFESCSKNCKPSEIIERPVYYPARFIHPWWGRRWFRRW